MTLIRARELTVSYGAGAGAGAGAPALSSLDLDVEAGAIGLLGPNGAGKSTLLKTLLGFIRPTRGDAEVLGQSVLETSAATILRTRIGYFPERPAYCPGLTAIQTVALAGELGGLPRAQALERAHEVLWFAGLGEARYRSVEGFSMGMRQRTKLAIAIVHDPDLVLLDEPTSGLDPNGRRQMLDLVRELCDRGMSVLLSTHLLHDVERVCDHAVVLDRGRLVLAGRVDELRREPGSVFEIRVREEAPGAFRLALEQRGLEVTEERDGLLRVSLSEGEAKTRLLFETARTAGSEIRHLRRFESSLEERFLTAVRNTAPADAGGTTS
jgi:ABC-2 type transport system ATP-binding protein